MISTAATQLGPASHKSPGLTKPLMKVLLVEDSAILAERMVEALQAMAPIELIDVVASEASALAALQKFPIDVVLLDLQLKQGTGFGILRGIAALDRKPHIVILTNYGLPEYQRAAIGLGAAHFLDKARDLGRLPAILLEILSSAESR